MILHGKYHFIGNARAEHDLGHGVSQLVALSPILGIAYLEAKVSLHFRANDVLDPRSIPEKFSLGANVRKHRPRVNHSCYTDFGRRPDSVDGLG